MIVYQFSSGGDFNLYQVFLLFLLDDYFQNHLIGLHGTMAFKPLEISPLRITNRQILTGYL